MATVSEIQQRLAAYRQAEISILTAGQEFEISTGPDGRRIARAPLSVIQKTIKQLEDDLALALARTNKGRTRIVSPTW